MAQWLTAEQERAWRNYRRMRTLLDLQITRDLKTDSDLSDADYDILSTLSESEDDSWRARDLAQRLLWSTSRLAHQVGRMEQRGLVERYAVHDDARGSIVTLSRKGRRVLEQAAAHHVDAVRAHFVGLLSASEIRALDGIARKVITHLAEDG